MIIASCHPHIVRLIDQFEDRKLIHLIMELCHGGDLFDYIASKTLLEEDLASCIIQWVSNHYKQFPFPAFRVIY